MKKNALRKDFLMEIRKSMGRFLSICLIVALGVIILVGLQATQPNMILSGDTYADQNKLMDIKIVSTLGLTEGDIDVIERLPAIEGVEGSYSADVLCAVGDNMDVVHLMSVTENLNTITVSEGRLPKTDCECFVDQDFLEKSGYRIGDIITFESGTENDLEDTLKKSSFKIVGSGNSPLYFSFLRGGTTIGNGSVSGYAFVEPEAFSMDVYTEIYAVVEDAKEELAFTDEYDELINEAIEQIEMIQNVRCEVRRDELAEMAQLEIDNARKELNSKKEEAEKEIAENESLLDASELELSLGEIQLQSGKVGIESGKAQLETAKALIESGKAQIESGKAELESAKKELEAGREELEASREPYDIIMDSLEERKASLQAQIEEWQAKAESMEGEDAEIALEMIATLQDSVNTLDAEITELTASVEEQFADGERQLAEAEQMIKDGEAELAAQEKDLLAQEKELLAKEKELLAQERQLSSSQGEIDDGKEAIEEGREELESAKEELETQLADAEAEIEEAEEKIEEIELPVWYIFDRSTIPDYTSFGDNAARIAALSLVFPAMFFLVAALISLTTMTRMVEEQRVQIGTLKALGYSKFSIVKKYLYYALAATLTGGIVGVLVGEKLLPYVIIDAYYNTVYTNIPVILIPYRWGIGLLAIIIAVACTCGAALSACYKELISQPAVLMRPETPKIGKKTLIEKIGFLWRSLNFSWKSSLRNLFRYKKRFFMTLVGIGGCMGLLMVGYGLRDSISSISQIQYDELQLYDCSIYLSDDVEDEDLNEIDSYLKSNKDIQNHMSGLMTSVTTKYEEESLETYLVVISDKEKGEEFFCYRDRKTKEIHTLDDEGVVISEKTAKMLGASVGDTILLTESGMNERKVTIAAITENYVSHWIYMTGNLYEEVYEEEPFYNSVFINVNDDVDDKKLSQIGEEILEFDNILNVQYTKDMVSSVDSMLVALDRVMILLILIAGLLSFVVLYNLNNINITERRRELATLKVLGFYDNEVAMYVYRENIMLTLFGTLMGCALGKFLHYFTIVTVEVDAAMFGREISLNSYLICAAFTVAFSIIVNIIMFFKLRTIDMVESLKSVE